MSDEVTRIHSERPWGSFDQFTHNAPSTVKVIRVSAGKRLSLQRHAKRAEYWYALQGSGTATIEDAQEALVPEASVFVPQGAAHRLTAGSEGITVLEIAFGEFDEEDIERIEDDFGRVPT